MIKIITKGLEVFEATCPRCLCKFTYELSDLVKRMTCEYVACPQCKHQIIHIARDWDHYCSTGEEKKW